MMKPQEPLILLVMALLLSSCHSGGKQDNGQFAFLDKLGISINEQLMLGDSLNLPDVYCGDPEQTTDNLKGKKLTNEQYAALVVPAGKAFADDMSNRLLLGVRDIGHNNTLAVFYNCSGTGYSVELITYDAQGNLLDAINARELHMLWRCDLSNPNDDNSYTLDGHFTFNGKNSLTLHRVMGRCLMDFNGDLKGKPQWQCGWNQDYVINEKGHFVLQGQHIVMEKGPVEQYPVLDFKSWDMLVCSLHDESVMDTWNDYAQLLSTSYDPNYQFNPFPLDVALLYEMNPQRFLRWMAARREAGNHLLPQFKLPPDDRPTLLQEIKRLDDASARQWLTSIVNNWDNKPLTKHL
jgi:hypothetical protein